MLEMWIYYSSNNALFLSLGFPKMALVLTREGLENSWSTHYCCDRLTTSQFFLVYKNDCYTFTRFIDTGFSQYSFFGKFIYRKACI